MVMQWTADQHWLLRNKMGDGCDDSTIFCVVARSLCQMCDTVDQRRSFPAAAQCTAFDLVEMLFFFVLGDFPDVGHVLTHHWNGACLPLLYRHDLLALPLELLYFGNLGGNFASKQNCMRLTDILVTPVDVFDACCGEGANVKVERQASRKHNACTDVIQVAAPAFSMSASGLDRIWLCQWMTGTTVCAGSRVPSNRQLNKKNGTISSAAPLILHLTLQSSRLSSVRLPGENLSPTGRSIFRR